MLKERERSGAKLSVSSSEPPRGSGARQAKRKGRMLSSLLANGVPLALLLGWWLISRTTPEYIIPKPQDAVEQTFSLLFGAGAEDTWTSMARIVIAVAIAMVIGGLLVVMATLVPATAALVGDRILPFLNSVSALGWAILGVIWFGVGNLSVIFVITAIIIPFCMVNLWEGMRNLDPEFREMGRSFTRSRARVLFLVEAPMLAPYFLAAARLSFSVGWKVALIAEFFGAQTGLGLVLNRSRQNFDTATVFGVIVAIVIIVWVVERVVFDPLGKWFAKRTGREPVRPGM